MRRRQFVDFMQGPRLPRIAIVMQDGGVPDTLGGFAGKSVSNRNLGNAVATDIPSCGVDHVRKIRRDHMPLPAWVLKPDKLRHVARERD